MRVLYFKVCITIIFLYPITSSAQLFLSLDSGVSSFAVHSNSNPNLKEEWGKQDYLQAYRFGIRKKWQIKNISFESGLIANVVGANHIFNGKWRYLYTGIAIGAQYKIGKASIGMRTTPALELWTNWPKFIPERSYNIDLEPNVAWDIGRRIQITGSASYGINPAVTFTEEVVYRNIAYFLGINYMISKRK